MHAVFQGNRLTYNLSHNEAIIQQYAKMKKDEEARIIFLNKQVKKEENAAAMKIVGVIFFLTFVLPTLYFIHCVMQ